MKTRKASPLLRHATLVCALMLARGVPAQTFTALHNFLGGSDGASPYSGLMLSSNVLYGTTYYETFADTNSVTYIPAGTIFSIHPDGSDITSLHMFAATTNNGSTSNGTGPRSSLILANDVLYGTTDLGGSSRNGTVFSVRIDGTGFTILHSFTAVGNFSPTNADGTYPSSLVLSGDTLFGTAELAGAFDDGTIFSVKTNGSDFTVLHTFNKVDGSQPTGGLTLSGHTLYGAASRGGPSGAGTIFSINTDGTGFTNLYNFAGNPDGLAPNGGLILSDGILYGTAAVGGASSSNSGTVFSVRTDGTGFTILHSFTPVFNGGISITNVDGGGPSGGLVLFGDTLYGTTRSGGTAANGNVFGLKTNGSDFTVLHNFTPRHPYQTPNGGLILLGNTLYGTTSGGGSSGYGTIFTISLAPELTLTPSRSSVVLTWPTNFTGFTVQSTTDLASRIWTTNLPSPVVVNGQNVVTNPISGTQQFFRLSQ